MGTVALTDNGTATVALVAVAAEEAGSLYFTAGAASDALPIRMLITSDTLSLAAAEVGFTLDEAEKMAQGVLRAVKALRDDQQGI